MMSRSEQGAYFEGKGWQPLPLMTDQYTPLSLPLESFACVFPSRLVNKGSHWCTTRTRQKLEVSAW